MARKGENIYRRKDGRWEGRYIADRAKDGRARYRSVYAKSYSQVKQKLQEAKEMVQKEHRIQNLPEAEKPFSEFLYRWLDYIRPRIKESSYVKYVNLIELHIDQEIGAVPLGRLNTEMIDEFINTMLTGKEGMEPLAAKTVTDILGVVRNVIRYINTRYQRLDCDLSQITIKKEESRMRILSREEEEQLIRYLMEYPSPMNCGIFLTLFTGLRIGELCALTWGISISGKKKSISRKLCSGFKTNSRQVQDHPKSGCRIRKKKNGPGLLSLRQKAGNLSATFLFQTASPRFWRGISAMEMNIC